MAVDESNYEFHRKDGDSIEFRIDPAPLRECIERSLAVAEWVARLKEPPHTAPCDCAELIMAQAGRDADALGLVAERVRGQSFMGSRVARETDNGLDKALISGGSDAQRLFGDSVEGVTSFVRDLEAAAKKARQAGSCPMSAVRAGLCLTVGLRGLRQVLADTAEVASPFFAGPYAHRVELASQMQALRDVFSALAGGQDRLVVMARAVLDGRGPE